MIYIVIASSVSTQSCRYFQSGNPELSAFFHLRIRLLRKGFGIYIATVRMSLREYMRIYAERARWQISPIY